MPRKTIPQQRKALYKTILPEIERIVQKHGFDDARFAINRWLTVTRQQLSIRREQAQLEQKLSELKAKLG